MHTAVGVSEDVVEPVLEATAPAVRPGQVFLAPAAVASETRRNTRARGTHNLAVT
ncbi:hypothetical protein PGC08_01575 [Brevibacterium sp. BDJS002]|uniref:hypothetical protein n=1 Tax=Brevibacterium sp. BDJS002 TaxID=3020906 RepID=UPI002307BBA7|nr:hypothetical protein [Brevibacterium sp. BDJS002]WCE40416.1 hypothetical protein PGC08_01575 [Brevibacterium sp. BDJS002]